MGLITGTFLSEKSIDIFNTREPTDFLSEVDDIKLEDTDHYWNLIFALKKESESFCLSDKNLVISNIKIASGAHLASLINAMPGLCKLKFVGCSFSSHAWKSLTQATRISYLIFENCKLSADELQDLSKLKGHLRGIKLINQNLSGESTFKISLFLENNLTLNNFYLKENSFTDDEMLLVTERLVNICLSSLHIEKNSLNQRAFENICKIACNPFLNKLSLPSSKVSLSQANQLIAATAQRVIKNSLTLNLSNNELGNKLKIPLNIHLILDPKSGHYEEEPTLSYLDFLKAPDEISIDDTEKKLALLTNLCEEAYEKNTQDVGQARMVAINSGISFRLNTAVISLQQQPLKSELALYAFLEFLKTKEEITSIVVMNLSFESDLKLWKLFHSNVISNSMINSLYFNEVVIDADFWPGIFELACHLESLQIINTNLDSLSLYKENPYFVKEPCLKKISFAKVEARVESWKKLNQFLISLKNLHSLSINNSNLNEEILSELAPVLEQNINLNYLDLTQDLLTPDTLNQLFAILKNRQANQCLPLTLKLTSLSLSDTDAFFSENNLGIRKLYLISFNGDLIKFIDALEKSNVKDLQIEKFQLDLKEIIFLSNWKANHGDRLMSLEKDHFKLQIPTSLFLENLFDSIKKSELTQELLNLIKFFEDVDLREDLFKVLLENEFDIKKIDGDGNCLYNSILQMYPALRNYEICSVNDLRCYVAEYMSLNHAEFENSISFEDLRGFIPPEVFSKMTPEDRLKLYCECIKVNPIWGGDLELQAIANILENVLGLEGFTIYDLSYIEKVEEGKLMIPEFLKKGINVKNHFIYRVKRNHFNVLTKKI